MKLIFTRSFVLSRLQERIEYLEAQHKLAIAHDAKVAEAEQVIGESDKSHSRYFVGAPPTAPRYAEGLKNVRFVIEHLPGTPTIECDFAHALLFGLVDPKTERVAAGFSF